MDILMLVVLAVILAFIVFKNIDLIKRTKFTDQYMNLYRDMLLTPTENYDKILAYLEKEKNKEYFNKTLLLKLYNELVLDKEYKETLNQLDFTPVFMKNGKFDNRLTNLNSDSFIWFLMVLFQLKQKEDIESMDCLINKLSSIESMDTRLEYAMEFNFYKQLKGEDGISFFRDFIDGNYTSYKYEKQMIGLYKRFAEAILAYYGEDVSEFDYDLNAFSKSVVGKCFMSQLGLYDKYKDPEINKEEEKTE